MINIDIRGNLYYSRMMPPKNESLTTHVVNYLPLAFMPEEAARQVAAQRLEERQSHLDALAQVDTATLETGELERKAWMEEQLGRETVNSTVFVHVVTPVPVNTFDLPAPYVGTL